ncbi:MAG: smc 1 [Mucilaginibacter sp.]|jgi:predicted nuclease with TOPRIM domain|nr:smc 1 [Mucilaginibacter sp.]
MENQTGQTPKKNSNVIYFLIVVVLALLATDVYLYLQKNKSDTKIVYQNDEKTRLQTELDSLEAQIEQVNTSKTKMSTEMQAKNDSLKAKIRVLRSELAKGKLTVAELNKAQEDVKQLRYFVTKYTADIEELKKQNVSLTTERDTLKTTLKTAYQKDSSLTKQNQDLGAKVKVGSAIKLATADVVAYKIKGSGKEVEVKRASPAKKIKINFTVASNDIAEKGMHDVYVRVIDPTGNLITSTDSGTFNADGQDIQFTYKTSIDFKNDGSGYTIDWSNPSAFQKGDYTVLLYADGYTMGKTGFKLK